MQNGDELCLAGNRLGSVAELTGRIGSASVYGEAFSAVHKVEKTAIRISVKKVPITKAELKSPFSKRFLLRDNSVWGEVVAYIFCTVLVLAETTQSLPIFYRYYTCKGCSFVNRNISVAKQPCLLIVNELADMDLSHFLKKESHLIKSDLILNCIFQIAQALYTLQYHLGMTHNDLHYGNVLVHKVKPGGYWEYLIDGKRYYLPNLGYVFVVWDFGKASIPRKLGQPSDEDDTDISRITDNIKYVIKKKGLAISKNVYDVIKFCERNSLETILHTCFASYTHKVDEDDILQTFNTNRRGAGKSIQKDLQYFFKHV